MVGERANQSRCRYNRIFVYSLILLPMAIYATPPKSDALLGRLEELDHLRRYLAEHLGGTALPWTGALRRIAAAEATVGSTSIEGYGASIEDTVEILAGRHPSGASDGGPAGGGGDSAPRVRGGGGGAGGAGPPAFSGAPPRPCPPSFSFSPPPTQTRARAAGEAGGGPSPGARPAPPPGRPPQAT